MADPVTMAIGGAAAGALLDKKDPLRGAALGGIGGYIGGPLFGAAAETPGAIAAVTPGITAGGEQAAMLAAQNAGLGVEGLLATGQAGGNAMLGASAMQPDKMKMMMQGAQMMNDKGQGQGQPMPNMAMAPPAMRPQFNPGTFQSLAPQFNPVIGNMPYNNMITADPRKRNQQNWG